MSEIDKLYENAGIKSEWRYIVHQFCHFYEADKEDILRNKHLFKERKTAKIKKAEKKYPPFTAEKQIAILQLLTQQCDLTISHFTEWEFIHFDGQEPLDITGKDFTETFVKLINVYWQDLTEEEKQQVKGILE